MVALEGELILRGSKNIAIGLIICGILGTSLNVFSYIKNEDVILFSDIFENVTKYF